MVASFAGFKFKLSSTGTWMIRFVSSNFIQIRRSTWILLSRKGNSFLDPFGLRLRGIGANNSSRFTDPPFSFARKGRPYCHPYIDGSSPHFQDTGVWRRKSVFYACCFSARTPCHCVPSRKNRTMRRWQDGQNCIWGCWRTSEKSNTIFFLGGSFWLCHHVVQCHVILCNAARCDVM